MELLEYLRYSNFWWSFWWLLIEPHMKISDMPKTTTIKDAIKKWEEANKKKISEAKAVGFQFQWPPIDRMDNSLSALVNCCLSANMIEKIAGVSSLKNLRILSLSKNYIKSFSGLEALGDTLEQLWLSYNFIEKLRGAQVLRKLKVLHINNNLIKEWSEFMKLTELSHLEELSFFGNPLYENYEESAWEAEVTKRLPNLKILDFESLTKV
ncbi:dynein axonemal light chain 1-like isoform X2 [Aethina tumida]|uniref:dynein axonemal light chain 1-like isoform X2 n=1 Tax=Aethina tumida TaxID=116153 RepID=UPI00096B60FD|nr:dynein axonemal light chain 1-like isoform X2 [Aethina tumida]